VAYFSLRYGMFAEDVEHDEKLMLADRQLVFELRPSRSRVRHFIAVHASWWDGYMDERVDV
jgi:hypothetical protein